MLKLKLQYFDHLMLRADLSEKTLMLRKIQGKRKSQGVGHDLATEQQQKPATIHFPINKMKNTHEIVWHNILKQHI